MTQKTNVPTVAELQDDKELAVVKSNTAKAANAAEALTIESSEDMESATELLSKINRTGDMIKARKEAITKPLNAALKSARDLFRPLETMHKDAKDAVGRKMIAYQTKVEKEDAEKKAKLAARVEKGTLKVETAAKKMEALPEVQNKVQTETGSVSFREVRVPTVVDEAKVPRKYLKLDMVAIRKDALAGVDIPGVEVKIEKQVANRR